MKGRFFLFFSFLLCLPLFSQEIFPPDPVCFDLMRRGTPDEVEGFLDSYRGAPELDAYLDDYLYHAAFWNPSPGVTERLLEGGAEIDALNPSGRTPLIAASRRNNRDVVETLLRRGADPSLQDRNGQSALHFAAAYGKDPRIIQLLIGYDAPPEARDRKGKTALEFALPRQSRPEILVTLIRSVPDLNSPLESGDTLYSQAFRREDPVVRSEIVAALFEQGASLRSTNSRGLTPLEEARQAGLSQMVHELTLYKEQLQEELFREMQPFTGMSPRYPAVLDLLARGADPLGVNREGLTPCQLAVIGGHPRILTLLLNYTEDPAPFDVGLEEFNSYLLFLSLTHPPEEALALTGILLEQGFSPDALDPDGNPLLTESLYNSLEITEMLLEAGADTEIRDPFGATPLMRAGSLENGADALELLLRHGADLNAVDRDQWNVLFYTVLFGGEIPAIEALINHGVDLDARDHYGSSVMLWAAAYHPDPGMAEYLAEGGVPLDSRDKDGWIPLMAALNWANIPEMVAYLSEKTADGRIRDGLGRTLDEMILRYEEQSGWRVHPSLDSLRTRRVYPPDSIPATDLGASLHETAQWGSDPEMIPRLVRAGADINQADGNGWTPLMKAAAYNQSAMVAAVLRAGADPLHATSKGWTALHTAAWSDDPETVRLLLLAGIPVDHPDRENWTPLMWAARNHAPERSLVSLLDAGADIGAESHNRESALYLAVSGWQAPAQDLLEQLAAAGSDPGRSNDEGITPLMKAAALGYEDTVMFLLEAGADPSAEDRDGLGAADYARTEGFPAVADLILSFPVPSPEKE